MTCDYKIPWTCHFNWGSGICLYWFLINAFSSTFFSRSWSVTTKFLWLVISTLLRIIQTDILDFIHTFFINVPLLPFIGGSYNFCLEPLLLLIQFLMWIRNESLFSRGSFDDIGSLQTNYWEWKEKLWKALWSRLLKTIIRLATNCTSEPSWAKKSRPVWRKCM